MSRASDVLTKVREAVSKTIIMWADEKYVGNLEKAKKKAKMSGKVGGLNWDQTVVNANAGNGVAFFIDAGNKGEAMDLIDKVEPHPNKKNVYYHGDHAKMSLGIR